MPIVNRDLHAVDIKGIVMTSKESFTSAVAATHRGVNITGATRTAHPEGRLRPAGRSGREHTGHRGGGR